MSDSQPTAPRHRCRLCHLLHPLRRCPAFLAMQSPQRQAVAEAHDYCRNCLATSHAVSECSSSGRCRLCMRKHHTLLHPDSAKTRRPAHSESSRRTAPNRRPAEGLGKKPATKPMLRTTSTTRPRTHESSRNTPPRAARRAPHADLSVARTATGLQTAAFRSRNLRGHIGDTIQALQQLQNAIHGASLQGGQYV